MAREQFRQEAAAAGMHLLEHNALWDECDEYGRHSGTLVSSQPPPIELSAGLIQVCVSECLQELVWLVDRGHGQFWPSV